MNLKQESVLFGLLSERANILVELSEKAEKQNAIIAEQRDTINRLTKEIESLRSKIVEKGANLRPEEKEDAEEISG